MIDPVDVRRLSPALQALETAVKAYFGGFFGRYCKGVFFCAAIHDGPELAGGTYGPSWIIVAVPEEFSDSQLRRETEAVIHHEFSSIIWQQLPLVRFGWALMMPQNWKPAESVEDALRAGRRQLGDHSAGFLTAYGATSSENDFNTYSELIFTRPDTVTRLAKSYPLIGKKAAVLMNAYISLEPRMEKVFAGLGVLSLRSYLDNNAELELKASAGGIGPTPKE